MESIPIFNLDCSDILSRDIAGDFKVHLVLAWVKKSIMQNFDKAILDIPAPILTRVFHELGVGLVCYHKALQVVVWPFPLPFVQLNVVMLWCYILTLPLIVSSFETHLFLSGLCTFSSVVCMVSLNHQQ